MNSTGDGRGTRHTVEGGVHATKIDQQANHSHADRGRLVILQLVFQNLASLAAPRHGVDVDVRKVYLFTTFGVSRESRCLVLKDKLEKLVLDIFAP